MSFDPGMFLDILTVVILVISIVLGAKNGFARTCLSFARWFVCIIAGFFLCTPLKEYLIANTNLDEAIHNYILDQTKTTIEETASYQAIPDLFSQWLENQSGVFVYGSAASLTNIILIVLAFVIINFMVTILGGILMLLLSKRFHHGVVGFLDSILGFLLGAIRGILLLFILFALLVPVLTLLPGTLSAAVMNAVDHSMVASILYDDNLLLILLRDLFS